MASRFSVEKASCIVFKSIQRHAKAQAHRDLVANILAESISDPSLAPMAVAGAPSLAQLKSVRNKLRSLGEECLVNAGAKKTRRMVYCLAEGSNLRFSVRGKF